jgi:hypothetical protein
MSTAPAIVASTCRDQALRFFETEIVPVEGLFVTEPKSNAGSGKYFGAENFGRSA